MYKTARVRKALLQRVADDCHVLHCANRVWPFCDYTAKGPACGVLIPIVSADIKNTPMMPVGVFELSDCYELVWKESTASPDLLTCIGAGGSFLKKAIAFREVDDFCCRFEVQKALVVTKDGSIKFELKGKNMATEVIVNIKPDGTTSVEVDGCAGSSCANLTSALEAALGNSQNKEYKAEFYQQDQRIRASN